MNRLKLIFQQTILVSTAILFVIGVEGLVSHFMKKSFVLEWYYPFSIIFTGFLCALPTAFLAYDDDADVSKKRFLLRVLLHGVLEFVIVSAAGYLFYWYRGLERYGIFLIEYFTVYFFVWAASIWIGKMNENRINKALKNVRDEE